MCRLWRAPHDEPLNTAIVFSTPRYPEIEIVIVPGATQPSRMTPTLTGALVWQMIQRCTVPMPNFWTAFLYTRSVPTVDIGLIRAEARAGGPVASGRDALSLSGNPQSAMTNATQSLNLTSGTITTHVTFQEALPVADAWESWLEAFLEWSSPLLTLKQSSAAIIPDDYNPIWKTTYALPDGTNIRMIARTVNRPQAAEALTYDEFFQGMQNVLESVIATNQYRYLDAWIYKHPSLAATFSVVRVPHSENAPPSIAVA